MWLDSLPDLHPKLGASQNESAYGSVPDPFPSPLKMGKGRQRQTTWRLVIMDKPIQLRDEDLRRSVSVLASDLNMNIFYLH